MAISIKIRIYIPSEIDHPSTQLLVLLGVITSLKDVPESRNTPSLKRADKPHSAGNQCNLCRKCRLLTAPNHSLRETVRTFSPTKQRKLPPPTGPVPRRPRTYLAIKAVLKSNRYSPRCRSEGSSNCLTSVSLPLRSKEGIWSTSMASCRLKRCRSQ